MVLKKFAAIFFLIVFSFNWFGYRIMYDYLQQKSNEKLEVFFDQNLYNESELLELKIAISLPYQNNSAFERCDGEIEIKGIIYKYVKRKLVNDTLYLLCYPNSKKMHLETAKNTFFKLTNDLQQNDNGNNERHSKSVSKNLQPVFNESSFAINIIAPFVYTKTLRLFDGPSDLPVTPQFIPGQPPEIEVV